MIDVWKVACRATPVQAIISVALTAVSLAGCSTYEGMKLSPTGDLEGRTTGIPFSLSRPEFLVTKEGTGADAKFKVTVTYVPDPDQRYTLRMSPALLANIQFDMALNDQGGLSSVTGSSVDQVIPTLQSLAELAIKFGAGGGILAPLKFNNKVLNLPIETARLTHQVTFRDSCGDPDNTPAAQAICVIKTVDTPTGCTSQIERLRTKIETQFFNEENPKEDKADLFSLLNYDDEPQRQCMLRMGANAAETADKDLEGYRKLAANWNFSNTLDRAFQARVVDILAKGDQANGMRLKYAIDVALKLKDVDEKKARARWRRLRQALSLSGDTLPTNAMLSDWQGKLVEAGIALPNTAPAPQGAAGGKRRVAAPLELASNTGRIARAFIKIASQKSDAWRARRLAELDRRIDEKLLELQQTRPTGSFQTDKIALAKLNRELDGLKIERAVLLDVLAQYERLKDLEGKLSDPPKLDAPPANNRLSPFDEYNKQRAEADRLLQVINARAEEIANAGKSKDTAATGAVVATRVDPICVRHSTKTDNWATTDGPSAPEFVVVLRPIGDSAGPQMLVEECP